METAFRKSPGKPMHVMDCVFVSSSPNFYVEALSPVWWH